MLQFITLFIRILWDHRDILYSALEAEQGLRYYGDAFAQGARMARSAQQKSLETLRWCVTARQWVDTRGPWAGWQSGA